MFGTNTVICNIRCIVRDLITDAVSLLTCYVLYCIQISFCRNLSSEQERVIDAVRNEIHMMAKLSHPNIVRILGATRHGYHFFMFVEWMPGLTVYCVSVGSFIIMSGTLIILISGTLCIIISDTLAITLILGTH